MVKTMVILIVKRWRVSVVDDDSYNNCDDYCDNNNYNYK